jgi:hypothetical protein
MVARALLHACHAQDTRHPLRHSTEHVAGDNVTGVGADFGPLLGQIWRWAKSKSQSPLDALQIPFKVHDH